MHNTKSFVAPFVIHTSVTVSSVVCNDPGPGENNFAQLVILDAVDSAVDEQRQAILHTYAVLHMHCKHRTRKAQTMA